MRLGYGSGAFLSGEQNDEHESAKHDGFFEVD
jgi:hypothetical protein